MPRLVLWPTAAMRRRDACANACADRGAGLSERRRRDARACLEVGDAHARVVAEAMHIAWLQRVELGEAGITKGLGNLRRCEARPHAPSWPRGRLAFRRTEASVEEGRDDGIGDARARDPL